MTQKTIIGIDEAGRGPVLGSLVVCAFTCTESEEKQLKKLGVRDSKLLTPARRSELARELKTFPHALYAAQATEINSIMQRGVSLNEFEAKIIAGLIDELAQTHAVKAFVDSPDSVPKKFEHRIRKYLHAQIELVCENKADVNHVCVGAASILAKTERDRQIEEIKQVLGIDFGNGYPSDKKTQEFVRKHAGEERLKPFLRTEWETVKRLKNHQVKLGEYL